MNRCERRFDVLGVETLAQSCSDGVRRVDTAAVRSLLVINESGPELSRSDAVTTLVKMATDIFVS